MIKVISKKIKASANYISCIEFLVNYRNFRIFRFLFKITLNN